MPEVTGIDVYRRTTQVRPELWDRFVFMTGGTFNATAKTFLESAGRRRIEKPFDVSALRNLVGEQVLRLTR
jgi:hypothetical protein